MQTYEQYVGLAVARLAKQVGFDWKVYTRYFCDEFREEDDCMNYNNLDWFGRLSYSAPTQSVLQRWLRETHHLHITIFSSSQESWMFRITKPHQKLEDGMYGEDFPTYETALEAGLQKCLTLLIEKQ